MKGTCRRDSLAYIPSYLANPSWRPSLLGWRSSLLAWRPSLLGRRPLLSGWRPSLLDWRPFLLGWRPLLLGWNSFVLCSNPICRMMLERTGTLLFCFLVTSMMVWCERWTECPLFAQCCFEGGFHTCNASWVQPLARYMVNRI